MGFAQGTHERQMTRSGGGDGLPTIFYTLSNMEKTAPAMNNFMVFETPEQMESGKGTLMNGHGEVVWFLNQLSMTPIISYHPTNTRDTYLSAETFDGFESVYDEHTGSWTRQCPVGLEYERLSGQYGDDKKDMPIKAMRQELVIPVYVPRRAVQGHIYTSARSQLKVNPVYWFRLETTRYIEEHDAAYNRLRAFDLKYPISVYPYIVFTPIRGEGQKRRWYFRPLSGQEYNPQQHGILIQHPLLAPPYIQDINKPSVKSWDTTYHDYFEHLPLLLHKQYHANGQPFHYGGHYANALKYYESMKGSLPPAATKVEAQPAGGGFGGYDPTNTPF